MTPRSPSSRSRPDTSSTAGTTAKQKKKNPSTRPHNGKEEGAKKRKRRPGRPLLSFAELAARKAARLSKKQEDIKLQQDILESSALLLKTAQTRRGNASSPLEKLPVELLERIFLYALETNFCRASPYLAAAVSSERIYRTLIRLAFFCDASSDGVASNNRTIKNATAREKIAEALKPADYATMQLTSTQQAYLQSTILKCRWCTKQRIQNQLPTLMAMTIQKHWAGENITISDPAQQASLDELLPLPNNTSVAGRTAASSALFRGTIPPANSKTYYMSITPLVSVSINCTEANIRDVHRVLSLRYIPDYLLRGRRSPHSKALLSSFAEEDIDLLELFRHEYGFDGSGHDVSFSRPALQAGIQTAIETQNARALMSLLKVDEFFFRRRFETDLHPVGTPAGSASQGMTGGGGIGGGGYYSIPGDHFLNAVNLPISDAIRFFKLLLRCNAESMPADSSEITQWAMELCSTPSSANTVPGSSPYVSDSDGDDDERDSVSGNMNQDNAAFGRWLLDFMIELPRHVDEARESPREKALFYYGAINSRMHGMGRRFLDEVCLEDRSRAELGQSWIQKMSFDVSKT